MKTQKVTIAGKEVGIAYCYATEIAFADYCGKTPAEIIQGKNPTPKEITYLILSAVMAYYKGEEAPIKDTDLMYNSTPQEMTDALTAVIKLFAEWYNVPTGAESKKKKTGKESKNV